MSRVRLPAKEEEEKEDTTRPDVKDDAKPQRADALELEQAAAVEAAAPSDRAVMEVERAMAAMASSLLRNQSFGTPGRTKHKGTQTLTHSLTHTHTHTVTTLASLSCLDNAVCWIDECKYG